MIVFGQKWLYRGKSGLFGQSCYIWAKEVVFGQKWLYSGKSGSVQAKVVIFGKKWLY